MEEVHFTLQTITPLFMAGADQTSAELRAPSFRGLMRYWLRAVVGGMAGTLEEVKKIESTIFGATDIGSGITVRVSEGDKKPVEYHKEGTRFSISGKDYLLWSMEQFRDKPRRLYFPQGTEFQVILSARDKDHAHLEQAVAAFWLLTHLGSVGSRSRRTAGSIMVQTMQGNTAGFRFDKAKDVKDLQTMLKQGIELARQAYHVKPQPIHDAKFDILSSNTCSIQILYDARQPWFTPDAAMKAIGESLQDYRRKIMPLWKRKIFGLPLKDVSSARRTSPLLLRLVELQGEQGKRYVGVAVLFKTTGKDPTGRFVSTKDYDLIEQWFNTFSGKLEVAL